jgi:hypothetical protein
VQGGAGGFGETCGQPNLEGALRGAMRKFSESGGSISDGFTIYYGMIRSGLRPLNAFSSNGGPNGPNGRAPLCAMSVTQGSLEPLDDSGASDATAEGCIDATEVLRLVGH